MKFYHESDLYTTTDEFPAGYLVWNIGEQHSPRGYIPLCKLKENQPFEWCRDIERDSLLALPVSDEIRRRSNHEDCRIVAQDQTTLIPLIGE